MTKKDANTGMNEIFIMAFLLLRQWRFPDRNGKREDVIVLVWGLIGAPPDLVNEIFFKCQIL